MSRWRHVLVVVVGFFALVMGNTRAPAAAQPPVAITIAAQTCAWADVSSCSWTLFASSMICPPAASRAA